MREIFSVVSELLPLEGRYVVAGFPEVGIARTYALIPDGEHHCGTSPREGEQVLTLQKTKGCDGSGVEMCNITNHFYLLLVSTNLSGCVMSAALGSTLVKLIVANTWSIFCHC